jgi:hypothetical protein
MSPTLFYLESSFSSKSLDLLPRKGGDKSGHESTGESSKGDEPLSNGKGPSTSPTSMGGGKPYTISSKTVFFGRSAGGGTRVRSMSTPSPSDFRDTKSFLLETDIRVVLLWFWIPLRRLWLMGGRSAISIHFLAAPNLCEQ